MLRCVYPESRDRAERRARSLDAIAIIWEETSTPGWAWEERHVATTALDITDETFEAEVVNSEKPVLVDFWAPWCAPCRTVGAVLDQLSGERADLKVVKINIDDYPDQAIKHGVLVLPTVVLYKDGEALGKLQGGVPPTAIARLLAEHLPATEEPAAEEAVEEPALKAE